MVLGYPNTITKPCNLLHFPLTLSGEIMTSKKFKIVGITEHDGNSKVRFTDDIVRRVKQFTKGGATRCDFIEMPTEMTKIDALKYMLTHPDFQSIYDQATITETLVDKEKEAKKGEIKMSSKPSLDAIRARARKSSTSVSDILKAVSN